MWARTARVDAEISMKRPLGSLTLAGDVGGLRTGGGNAKEESDPGFFSFFDLEFSIL